jgi:hypothetical protein
VVKSIVKSSCARLPSPCPKGSEGCAEWGRNAQSNAQSARISTRPQNLFSFW